MSAWGLATHTQHSEQQVTPLDWGHCKLHDNGTAAHERPYNAPSRVSLLWPVSVRVKHLPHLAEVLTLFGHGVRGQGSAQVLLPLLVCISYLRY